jgi:ABC-type cobalamin/Fe3+-siderophores transport system ATPase subunit
MKEAQVVHAWARATQDWSGAATLKTLSVHSAAGFRSGTVTLSGGLALIVGINSAGKSRLLRDLQRTMRGEAGFTTIAWDGDPPDNCELIDLAHLVERQVRELRIGHDLDDRIDELSMAAFSQSAVANAAYMLGREFEEIRVAELEATVDLSYTYESTEDRFEFRSDVVPYFQVVRGGIPADSRELSKGELSALTLIWALGSAQAGSVILWDEPDAFLSPYSAEHALDLIADSTNSLKTPMVVSTHAFLSVARAPRSAQVMLRLHGDGTTSVTNPDGYALWKTLRVSPPQGVAFVVEDNTARVVMDRLLLEMNYEYRDLTAIWVAGNADTVNRAAEFPSLEGANVTVAGVLDGDMRGKRKMSKHALYLPTSLSPKGKPRTPEAHTVAELIRNPSLVGWTRAEVDDALDQLAGRNDHDKIRAIAKGLSMSEGELVFAAVLSWITGTDEGGVEFERFMETVKLIVPRLDVS